MYRSPLKTVYCFGRYSAAGIARGFAWFLSHPATLYVLLPAVAVFAAAKYAGYNSALLLEVEVRSLLLTSSSV